MSADRPANTAKRHRPRKPASFAVPRLLPWSSMLSRTWPGTLIVCWTVLTSLLLVIPTWPTVGAVAAVLLVASIVAKVPPSAVPRPPLWFWSGFLGGVLGAWLGGGLLIFLRASAVAVLILWGSALLLWTVPTRRMTAAIRSLLTPLGWFGAPIDEWTRVMSLALRGLPATRDQAIAVMDTVKLRLGSGLAGLSIRELTRMTVDVVTATLSAASRGAADTGRAMSVRGGLPPLERERMRVGWRDLIVVVVCAVAVAVIVVFG